MKKQTVANKSSTITNLIALLAFLGAIVEGIIGILAINVQLDFQKYLNRISYNITYYLDINCLFFNNKSIMKNFTLRKTL